MTGGGEAWAKVGPSAESATVQRISSSSAAVAKEAGYVTKYTRHVTSTTSDGLFVLLCFTTIGVFDGSKLDLSSLETNAAAEFLTISTAPPADDDDVIRAVSEPRSIANPKLGLAPLNSEKTTLTTSNSTDDSASPLPTGGSGVTRSSSWPAGGHGEGGNL